MYSQKAEKMRFWFKCSLQLLILWNKHRYDLITKWHLFHFWSLLEDLKKYFVKILTYTSNRERINQNMSTYCEFDGTNVQFPHPHLFPFLSIKWISVGWRSKQSLGNWHKKLITFETTYRVLFLTTCDKIQ